MRRFVQGLPPARRQSANSHCPPTRDVQLLNIINFGAEHAAGEYMLLLNNDTEVISPDWMETMLGFGQRDDVGIVGAKLLFPDKKTQHAGVIVGIHGVAAHIHKGQWLEDAGYEIGR